MSTLLERTIGRVVGDHRRAAAPPAPRRPRRPAHARPPVVTRAELAECTCPDACERDHEHD